MIAHPRSPGNRHLYSSPRVPSHNQWQSPEAEISEMKEAERVRQGSVSRTKGDTQPLESHIRTTISREARTSS
jgi:hypothetical protein